MLILVRERVRKHDLNIACPTLICPVHHDWGIVRTPGILKEKQDLTVVTWNMQTLVDSDNTSRPERHTALIATEATKYRIDIASLSETKLAVEGSIKDPPEVATSSFGKGNQQRKTEFMALLLLETAS